MSLLAAAVLHTVAAAAGWLHGLNACTVPRHEWVTPAMVALTFAGTDPPLFALVGALAWRRRRHARWLIGLAVLARLLVALLKVLLREPRPDFPPLPELVMAPRSWSYPSGHAMMSMVVLGAAAMQIGRAAWFAALIGGIGFSRLYLGVHWLNDVIGGYLWGAAVLACAWRLQRLWDRPGSPAGR